MAIQTPPVKIFIAYSRLDSAYLQELKKYLRPLNRRKTIQIWYDGEIIPGTKWAAEINRHLNAADIILLLISANSLNSDYFYDEEMQKALDRHEKGEAKVIPVILRHCTWRLFEELSELQALPKDGMPLSTWGDDAEAYTNVVEELHRVVISIRKQKAEKIATQQREEKAAIEQRRKEEQEKTRQAKIEEEEREVARLKKIEEEMLEVEKLKKEEQEKTWWAESQRKKEQEAARLKKIEEEKISSLTQAIQELLQNMVIVEGGTFQMGSNEGYDREKPVHQVTIPTFQIARYPVTQVQWQAVMENNPSRFKDCDNCPVETISWNDCKAFIQKLNQLTGKKFRLPSEAEWEFAARGGNKSRGYQFSGSKNLNEVAWYRNNADEKTHPVGEKIANELGLFDMSGNVWEWCEDDWHENYKNAPSDGSAWIDEPRGKYRLVRGGSWYFNTNDCRVTYRRLNDVPFSYYSSSLRLALSHF